MSARQVCVATAEHGPDATCFRCAHEGPMVAAFDRSVVIARVSFIMPGLNDNGLKLLGLYADLMALRYPRDLAPATLAAEQAAREGRAT